MRITFEKVSDQLYIRNELYQSLVRSVFALHPGDLSVQLDDRDRSRFCDLCLAKQEHSLSLHNSRLRMARDGLTALRQEIVERSMPPDARRVHQILDALPWPVRRSPRA